MKPIIAIADDLSGAAETAAAFITGHGGPTNSSARSAQHVTLSGMAAGVPVWDGLVPVNGDPQVCLLPRAPEELDVLLQEISGLRDSVPAARPLVLDTDNRSLPAGTAAGRLRRILDSLPAGETGPTVFLKIDSLFRGPVASQLGVLAASGPVILAPALPPLGRSTLNGTVHHGGVPLHETSLWHAESSAPPATISAAIAPLPAVTVGLAAVRSGNEALHETLVFALGAVAGAGSDSRPVVICDAETPADLDAIVSAALRIPSIRFAGASALGAALSSAVARTAGGAPGNDAGDVDSRTRSLAHSPDGQLTEIQRPEAAAADGCCPLLVVGSASGPAREQLRTLAAAGVPVIALSPADLLAGTASLAPLEQALTAGPAAVTVADATVDPALSAGIVAAFARAVIPIAGDRPLMLTGGETARAVLDALGVLRLSVLGEVEHGAVVSLTPHGRRVVTRPGSFGDADSLRTILAALTDPHAKRPCTANTPAQPAPLLTASRPSLPKKGPSMNLVDSAELPYVAVTMGDGAGVGPEVVVAAVLDPQTQHRVPTGRRRGCGASPAGRRRPGN